jgi:tRNA_anti-like
MSKKKIIWLFVLLAIVVGTWYGYKEYNRTNKDPDNANARYTVVADELVKEFENGNSVMLNKKYDDEIIEVSGIVKEIKKNEGNYTILLGDSSILSSVQCEMNVKHQQDAALVTKGSSVKIKGHFVGFQKGEIMMDVSLGSTINLNRCILLEK